MYISYQLFNLLVCGIDSAFNHELLVNISFTSVEFSSSASCTLCNIWLEYLYMVFVFLFFYFHCFVWMNSTTFPSIFWWPLPDFLHLSFGRHPSPFLPFPTASGLPPVTWPLGLSIDLMVSILHHSKGDKGAIESKTLPQLEQCLSLLLTSLKRERERTTTVEWANALKGKGKELGGISGHCDMARGDGTICLVSSRVSTKLSQNYLIIPSRSRSWNVFSFWSASAWRNELGRPAKPLRRLLEGLLRDLVWWCTTHSTWDVEAGAFPWVEARMGDKSQTQVQKNTI